MQKTSSPVPPKTGAQGRKQLISELRSRPPRPIFRAPAVGGIIPSARGHKYGARATVVDGIRFPSIAEAKFYERSKERQAIGEIFYFTLWPVFVLPGGIRVRLDQQIVYPNNNGIDYYDVKGVITPQFKKNKRLVEHFWPIKIKVVIYQKGKFVEVEI